MKKAVIIGSGFSGLSAATFLAKYGWDVTVIEKHNHPGGTGKAVYRRWIQIRHGPKLVLDAGVFERYFNCFGKNSRIIIH